MVWPRLTLACVREAINPDSWVTAALIRHVHDKCYGAEGYGTIMAVEGRGGQTTIRDQKQVQEEEGARQLVGREIHIRDNVHPCPGVPDCPSGIDSLPSTL